MIADALEGEKLIAMALLKPGWETQYAATPAVPRAASASAPS